MTADFVAAASLAEGAPRKQRQARRGRLLLRRRRSRTRSPSRMPDLAAAVPFYGAPPGDADVPKIKAAVLAHHAELDTRLASDVAGVRRRADRGRRAVTRATSTRRPITASTTTRRRATTRRPRSSRGSAPWTGSTRTCGSVVQTLLKIGDGVLERGHALLERDALGARRGRAFDEVVQGDAERARERNGEEQTGIVRLIALDP